MTSKFKKRKMSLKDRKFNLVYFVDSEKSRSIQLSLRGCIIVAFLIAVLGMSCLCGGVWGLTQAYKFSALTNDNQMLRKTLFEYQSRYDGVYSVAYPESENVDVTSVPAKKSVNPAIQYSNLPTSALNPNQNPESLAEPSKMGGAETMLTSTKASTSENNAEDLEGGVEDSTSSEAEVTNSNTASQTPKDKILTDHKTQVNFVTTSRKEEKKGDHTLSVGSPTATDSQGEESRQSERHANSYDDRGKKKVAALKASDKSPELKNTSLEIVGSFLKVKFDLYSHPPNTLYTGNIWLSVEMESNGKRFTLNTPSHVLVSENGSVMNPNQGEKYRVRNFTSKRLSLKVTPEQHKNIKKVTIGISDLNGKYRLINVPLSTVNSEKKTDSKRG